jgi:hypothetical protein
LVTKETCTQTDLPGDLGADPRGAPFGDGVLEDALLRLRQHEPLEHPRALHRDVHGRRAPDRRLGRRIISQERERPRRPNKRMRSQSPPFDRGPVVGEPDLAVHGAQIEEHGGLLEVNVLLGGLLLVLEGVMPGESDGVDVVLVRGDWESGLHEAEGLEVVLEEVASGGGGRVGLALEVGAELLEGLEVVVQVLGLALRIVESNKVAERAEEVDRGGLLLQDREHYVGGRRRRCRTGHGGRIGLELELEFWVEEW